MTLEQPEMQTGFINLSVTPNKKLRAEIQQLPLKKLKLDLNNVRFHHRAEHLTDAQIEKEIWEEDDTKFLLREILASRGLSEPPIVNSNLVVVEGNRRVVCLRKLSEKTHKGEYSDKYSDITQDHWDTVTCHVLPGDTPEKDIAILLGRLHVSGKKEWAALNQAAHIYELANKYGATQEDIREYLSMSKATVNHMIQAFKATTEYGEKYPEGGSWIYKFSYFYEMYKRKPLREWLETNSNSEKFQDWLGNGKLTRGMEVRQLPDIILMPEALNAMDSGGFAAALKLLQRSDPAIGNKFYARVKDMVEQLNNVPREELVETGNDPTRLGSLQKLRDTVDEVLRNVAAIKR